MRTMSDTFMGSAPYGTESRLGEDNQNPALGLKFERDGLRGNFNLARQAIDEASLKTPPGSTMEPRKALRIASPGRIKASEQESQYPGDEPSHAGVERTAMGALKIDENAFPSLTPLTAYEHKYGDRAAAGCFIESVWALLENAPGGSIPIQERAS
jgi:hypothetical protein